ncbi:MAG TPA: hypothetical protein VK844_03260 [Hyphomicrobiales bacterium]|nr:hypothetical protein [Hyphomicrobiales bacterium]
MKKTLLTLAAAAALSLAAAAPTATPASAGDVGFSFGIHGDGFSVGFGTPGYYGPHYGHGHHFGPGSHRHCKRVWKKVWTPGGPIWKKVKQCRRHRHL